MRAGHRPKDAGRAVRARLWPGADARGRALQGPTLVGRGAPGMTLLEMMVAMSIVIVMMGFLIPIYVKTMKVKSRTEEVAALHSTGRGAMGVLRRDLTGAFRTAVAMYDFANGFRSGAEFHWEAPVNPADMAAGFRRVTFLTAVDGSRLDVASNALRPFDYNVCSWAARGGVFFREVGLWKVDVSLSGQPAGWIASPPGGGGEGVRPGAPVYNEGGSPLFQDVGVYGGSPYIMTTAPATPGPMQFNVLGEETGVTATLCFAATEVVPDWAAADFAEAPGAGLTLTTGPCRLFTRFCPEGRVALGPNVPGSRYFVILGSAWWSLGEEARTLVFYPPADYVDSLEAGAGPDDNLWEDSDDGAADGVWSGGVPPYVDVKLDVSDTESWLGRRAFGERVAIPAGGKP